MDGISGLWLGKCFKTNETKEMRWSLSLTNTSTFPSAFGGSAISNSCENNLLVGSWNEEEGKLTLRESKINVNKESTLLYTYTGKIVHSIESHTDSEENIERSTKSSPCIVGMWNCCLSNESGQFICRKEVKNTEIHVSGLWVGQAVPDVSLKEFYLPVNPIRWSLTIIRRKIANKLTCPSVFGAGYFDDAADIANQPVICYTLSSTELSEMKSKADNDSDIVLEQFSITKLYEYSKETEGVRVLYSGKLILSSSGNLTIQGTWTNDWAGSFGQFSCSLLKDVENYSTHQIFCNLCQNPILPNEIMFECPICVDEWRSCTLCYIEKESNIHGHKLLSETRFKNECVMGSACNEIVINALQLFNNRPFIGFRETTNENGYQWKSYGEIKQTIEKFTFTYSEIMKQNKIEIHGNYCVIIGKLSEEYIVSLLSSLLLGFILVPVDANIDDVGVQHIINKISASICIIDDLYFDKFYKYLPDKSIIISIPSTKNKNIPYDNKFIFNYNSLLENSKIPSDFSLSKINTTIYKEDDLVAILFTSGSSGNPKGAAYTQKLIMPPFGVANVEPLVRFDFQEFHPSFIVSLLSIMRCGGRRAISTNLHDLIESISKARPTHISAPPVLFHLLYSEYQSQLNQKIHKINTKIDNNKMNELKKIVSQSIRSKLGNRLVSVSSGGASIPHSILKFCNDELELGLVDLYGSRETGPIAMNGIVYSSVEICILSEDGVINNGTQGEILVHSPRLIETYINDPEKTSSAFLYVNDKRFYKTGDFGETWFQNGSQHIRVLDRVGFAIKMIQGEWLSPSRLESILEGNTWIHQAVIFGNAKYSFPIAFIVPSPRIYELSKKPFSKEDYPLIEQKIQSEIIFWCEHHHIKHIPQRIKIIENEWTVENGFLTPTLKKRRRQFLNFYAEEIEKLYNNKEEIKNSNDSQQLSSKFLELLHDVFPFWSDFSGNSTLGQLGADSLQIASLYGRILQFYNNDNIKIRDLFEYSLFHIDKLIFGEEIDICLPKITKEVDWIDDCNLGKLNLYFPKDKKQKDILLTGCTGFFGPVLLIELFFSFSSNTKIYCLMRGKSIEKAEEKLLNSLREVGCKKFNSIPNEKIMERIIIILGDLSEEKLGLSQEIWDKLIQNLSKIYHSGAFVNLVLPYSSLKKTNVNSTREIIHLAALSGSSIDYVSSVSVLSDTFNNEDWLPSYYRSSSTGYAASKIVSEILLHQAFKQGIPVRIYRISTISGHQESGYFNIHDFTGMLISVCVFLGCAVGNSAMKLQWLPVDYVAHSLVRLSLLNSKENRVFHLCGNSPRFCDVVHILKEYYSVKEVSLSDWREALSKIPPSSRFYPLISTFISLHFNDSSSIIEISKTNELLNQMNITSPDLTTKFLLQDVKYLESKNCFQ